MRTQSIDFNGAALANINDFTCGFRDGRHGRERQRHPRTAAVGHSVRCYNRRVSAVAEVRILDNGDEYIQHHVDEEAQERVEVPQKAPITMTRRTYGQLKTLLSLVLTS